MKLRRLSLGITRPATVVSENTTTSKSVSDDDIDLDDRKDKASEGSYSSSSFSPNEKRKPSPPDPNDMSGDVPRWSVKAFDENQQSDDDDGRFIEPPPPVEPPKAAKSPKSKRRKSIGALMRRKKAPASPPEEAHPSQKTLNTTGSERSPTTPGGRKKKGLLGTILADVQSPSRRKKTLDAKALGGRHASLQDVGGSPMQEDGRERGRERGGRDVSAGRGRTPERGRNASLEPLSPRRGREGSSDSRRRNASLGPLLRGRRGREAEKDGAASSAKDGGRHRSSSFGPLGRRRRDREQEKVDADGAAAASASGRDKDPERRRRRNGSLGPLGRRRKQKSEEVGEDENDGRTLNDFLVRGEKKKKKGSSSAGSVGSRSRTSKRGAKKSSTDKRRIKSMVDASAASPRQRTRSDATKNLGDIGELEWIDLNDEQPATTSSKGRKKKTKKSRSGADSLDSSMHSIESTDTRTSRKGGKGRAKRRGSMDVSAHSTESTGTRGKTEGNGRAKRRGSLSASLHSIDSKNSVDSRGKGRRGSTSKGEKRRSSGVKNPDGESTFDAEIDQALTNPSRDDSASGEENGNIDTVGELPSASKPPERWSAIAAEKGESKSQRAFSQLFSSIDIDGVHDAKAEDRFAHLEEFERSLNKEREEMQKEKEALSYEKESLEMQLHEELDRNETLTRKVKDLERQLQSEKMNSSGNNAAELHDLTAENQELKLKLKRERRETEQLIYEKETEIDHLNEQILKMSADDDADDISVAPGDKSRGRLQGELMQANAAIKDRDSTIANMQEQISGLNKELDMFQTGNGMDSMQQELRALRQQKNYASSNFEAERDDLEAKLKSKDETISYLMAQLAKLKQQHGQGMQTMSGHGRLNWFEQPTDGNRNASWFDLSGHGKRRESMSNTNASWLNLSSHGSKRESKTGGGMENGLLGDALSNSTHSLNGLLKMVSGGGNSPRRGGKKNALDM